MLAAINNMMLDMLAAISRKDYLNRRERAAQGIAKAKIEGKYTGRKENAERNALILKLLKAGDSWNDIMGLVKCSRATVAKQAALLKGMESHA
jgi:DNA invertase Pin-like site-specific DNA recombinase